ncbi:MAG: hypothetical protein V3T86_02390 [Planctomycetota bacterium]
MRSAPLSFCLFVFAYLPGATVRAGGEDAEPRGVPDELSAKIDQAVVRARRFLRVAQDGSGPWSPRNPLYTRHKGRVEFEAGLTALAVYAMAAASAPQTAPSIQRAIHWLDGEGKAGLAPGAKYATYSNSFLVLALTSLDPVRYGGRIRVLVDKILAGRQKNGLWGYRLLPNHPDVSTDHSNTQVAVLALWAGESLGGATVLPAAWTRIRTHFQKNQRRDGSWGYTSADNTGTATMTCAGLSVWIYAAAALEQDPANLDGLRKSDTASRALGWLRRHSNPGYFRDAYYRAGLERVGTLLARPKHEWYLDGASYLIRHQRPGGGWSATDGAAGIYETALCTLFLCRATLPPRTGESSKDAGAPGRDSTRGGEFPDLVDPGEGAEQRLERAMTLYGYYADSRKAAVAPLFAARGPKLIGYLVEALRHKEVDRRRAAYDLLTRLIAREVYFDPVAPPKQRTVMHKVIDSYWKKHRNDFRWDTDLGRFTVRE